MRPLISIISVSFNDIDGILRSIKSVQDQDGINSELVEHIIIDGGTENFPKKLDGDIKINIISEKDNGLYDAMNKGISISKGKYLIFLNGGDLFYDSFVLSKIIPILEKLNKDFFIFGRAQLVDEMIGTSRLFPSDRFNLHNINDFLRDHLPCHQAMFIPRDFCEKELYDLKYKVSADAKFKKILLKKYKAFFVDFPIVSFDLCGVSSSTNNCKQLEIRMNDSYYLYKDGLSSFGVFFRSIVFHLFKYVISVFKIQKYAHSIRKILRG